MRPYEFQREIEWSADRRRAKPIATMRVHSRVCGDARVRPHRLIVRQEEYRHDVAIVYAYFDKELSKRVKPKCPVTIRWGRRGLGRARFHGYVHSIEPSKESGVKPPRGQRRVKIIMKAASTRFRIRESKLWKGKSVGKIVQKTARQHFFSADIPKDSRGWLRIQQKPSEQTWDFLVRIAKRSGMTFYARNMKLVLYPRDTPPLYMWLEARLFRGDRGEIRNFEVVDSSEVDGGDEEASDSDGQTVNPRKVKVVTIIRPKQPKQRRGRPDPCMPVVNLYKAPKRVVKWVKAPAAENQQELREEVKQRELYPVRATVRLQGDHAVHQGAMVRLADVGTRDEGLWYVVKLRHIITPYGYAMLAELGRKTRAPMEEPVVPPDPTLIDDTPTDDSLYDDDPFWDDGKPIYDPTRPPVDEEPVLSWPLPDDPDLPDNPDGEIPDEDDVSTDPGLPVDEEPPRLPSDAPVGPTCPVQPRPYQNGEWRSPNVGPQSVRVLV